MTVFVSKTNQHNLETIFNPPYTLSYRQLKYKTTLKEIDQGDHLTPFPFSCAKLYHSSENFGYRFNLNNLSIGYSGDTGINDAGHRLFHNVDLLIHECSLLPGESLNSWGHVEPREVADFAKKEKVGKLILTHFDADRYTDFARRRFALKEAKKIFPQTILAKDDMELYIDE